MLLMILYVVSECCRFYLVGVVCPGFLNSEVGNYVNVYSNCYGSRYVFQLSASTGLPLQMHEIVCSCMTHATDVTVDIRSNLV